MKKFSLLITALLLMLASASAFAYNVNLQTTLGGQSGLGILSVPYNDNITLRAGAGIVFQQNNAGDVQNLLLGVEVKSLYDLNFDYTNSGKDIFGAGSKWGWNISKNFLFPVTSQLSLGWKVNLLSYDSNSTQLGILTSVQPVIAATIAL